MDTQLQGKSLASLFRAIQAQSDGQDATCGRNRTAGLSFCQVAASYVAGGSLLIQGTKLQFDCGLPFRSVARCTSAGRHELPPGIYHSGPPSLNEPRALAIGEQAHLSESGSFESGRRASGGLVRRIARRGV